MPAGVAPSPSRLSAQMPPRPIAHLTVRPANRAAPSPVTIRSTPSPSRFSVGEVHPADCGPLEPLVCQDAQIVGVQRMCRIRDVVLGKFVVLVGTEIPQALELDL